jgi:hypothetical protein
MAHNIAGLIGVALFYHPVKLETVETAEQLGPFRT